MNGIIDNVDWFLTEGPKAFNKKKKILPTMFLEKFNMHVEEK